MKMKKIVATGSALALTAAVAVGGTLAYLQDASGDVVNTFTWDAKNAIQLTLLRASASPEMRADNRVHHFVYGFMAWEGSFLESPVVQRGYELNVPMQMAEGACETRSAFGIDRDNVILDTVKLAEDGSGDFILRLYESKHADTTARVRLGIPAESAFLCSMMEEEEETAVMEGNELVLHFKPFEIKTVRVCSK